MKIRILAILLLSAVQPLSAQQWVEKKNDFSLLFTQDFRTYDKVYDFDGNRTPSPTLQHYVSTLTGEYAINDNFSVMASVPFLIHNSIEKDSAYLVDDVTVNKPGEVVIGARYNHRVNENLFASAFFQQSLATAEDDATYGLNTGYNDFAQYVGGTIRYSANDKFYAGLDLGFRLRHKDFGDEIEALAEVGIKIKNGFWFIARSNGVQPLENGDDKLQGGNFGLYQQYEGFWDTGAGLRYNHPHWEFSALFNANFKGQYSPATTFMLIGVKYRILDRD